MKAKEDKTPTTLRRLVRRRRIELELSQEALAKRIGVTAEFICIIECGKRRLHLDRVPSLASALACDRKRLCKIALQERRSGAICGVVWHCGPDRADQPLGVSGRYRKLQGGMRNFRHRSEREPGRFRNHRVMRTPRGGAGSISPTPVRDRPPALIVEIRNARSGVRKLQMTLAP